MIDSKSIQINLSHVEAENISLRHHSAEMMLHVLVILFIFCTLVTDSLWKLHLFINEQQIQTSSDSSSPPFNQINKWIIKNNESD